MRDGVVKLGGEIEGLAERGRRFALLDRCYGLSIGEVGGWL